ncbi:MAG: ribonuclease Y [Candidatus Pacebacteria bacterium]|jgi:ribonucrease Y|nr:ribonuclease Y [Candidatus Paceibacterota bacterium]MBT3511896.1 ribonuclease Y [Candidatus Paceibacterota bacterium]MBT4004587.1 ribonuclease Y [Candidatus Paceibacterota bacterium]MBT4359165.1 ribonuclease Y [Candidatus Paceibacterota bacterium]MBT4680772.1 ribonuclease Y [Candidatus Paceibacterota bacterium]
MSFFGNLSTLFGTQEPSKKQPTAKKKSKLKTITPTPLQSKGTKSKPTIAKKVAKATPTPAPTQVKKRVNTAEDNQVLGDARAQAREIIVEARDEALTIRLKADNRSREANREIQQQQQSLDSKLSKIEDRLSSIDTKEERIGKQRQEVEKLKEKTVQKEEQVLEKLEKASGLTTEEAKQQLFADLEKKLGTEMSKLIRQKEEEAKNEADDKAKEILVDAMKHGATDYVAEYTISTVQLPSEEVKGKIIGKSGRNIHAFERITGVDVDLDAEPTSVKVSCFDPIRREIARVALERLIKDGRIQPARIEEVVAKVRKEIDKITFEAGKKLCQEVGAYNLPNELMGILGRFKYRFSYGQNLIAHVLEETKIGIKLAHEMKVDVNTVRLGCLLHDVGKVVYDVEGSHVELGVKVAKRFGLPKAVVDCIAQHHEDEPFSGPEQMIVYIADAISGARPGARYENHEGYVERLEQLESIANSYEEVAESYAIQAGREVRVLLKPDKSKDDDVTVLAAKIRDEIKDNVTYPGTVTVTVIRETRFHEVAK